MNNVIAYKQFSLGEGLADLFASEVKNFEAFKASIVDSAKNFRQMFGDGDFDKTCHDREVGDSYDKGCTSHNRS